MSETNMPDRSILRFAPSPNGRLHLGHALSALVNSRMARELNGRLLLRIEDIDRSRCRPDFEKAIFEDLSWLGVRWEGPVRRQSDHFSDYAAALDALIEADIVYPAFMSRSEIKSRIAGHEADGASWPRDPDGSLLYPSDDRVRPKAERKRMIDSGKAFAWRLDMGAALAHAGGPPSWEETGAGPDGETGRIAADPRAWGDVVIARRDIPTSYHLAVVVDDAIQKVSHVVRGRDLFHATAVQRVLQELLGLPAPVYHHHDLVLGDDGWKLSKSRGDTAISSLRDAGATPCDIARMVDAASKS